MKELFLLWQKEKNCIVLFTSERKRIVIDHEDVSLRIVVNDFCCQCHDWQKQSLMKRMRYETGNAQKGNVRLQYSIHVKKIFFFWKISIFVLELSYVVLFDSIIKDKILMEFSTYGKNLITEHARTDSIWIKQKNGIYHCVTKKRKR